ncbi:MAG: AAA family ATPase [Proteobacteria bacterium]|nr:AAA family ATPase [Pseudomonadota bacterium]
MDRYLTQAVRNDLARKIILITGPRQSGKTTLSKMLVPDFDYLNFDSPEHRLRILDRTWDRKKAAVIFDELHNKLKNWKSWLKGVYDTEGIPPALVVTGSAKLIRVPFTDKTNATKQDSRDPQPKILP